MDDQIAYIEDYFNDQLRREEKLAFERRCLADAAFAEIVAFYISLQNESKHQWIEKKKEEFNDLDVSGRINGIATFEDPDRLTTNEEINKYTLPGHENGGATRDKLHFFKLWKPLAAAAMVIGIISLGINWWYANDKKEDTSVVINENKIDSQITSNNKKPGLPLAINVDTNSPKLQHPSTTPRTDSTAVNKNSITTLEMEQLVKKVFVPDQLPSSLFENLDEPAAYYKKGQYAQAIPGYKKVLDEIRAHDDADLTTRGRQERELAEFLVRYYLGQSYLYLGHSVAAIAELDSAIVVSPDTYWKSKAEWYLALAYLKSGKIQKAVDLLQNLSRTNEARAYQQKAIELKDRLTKK